MSIGNQTVQFAIKAVADLAGVKSAGAALESLAKDGTDAGKAINAGTDAAGRGLDGLKTKAAGAATSIKGIAAATAGILAVGVTLFKVGSAVDAVTDSIQVATGATGQALDNLAHSAITVFQQVPTTLDQAGEAIAGLAQKTGDTGKALEDLAASELELSRITNTDLTTNITASAAVFKQWGVAASDQVGVLDKLFRAFQNGGGPVDQLSTQLTQYGPILRSMNLSLDDSIALLAALNKAGVDTGSVMTGLRTAISKFSSEGVTDFGAALQSVFEQIKNAPNDTKAATLAIDTFGARAGPALANSIRTGQLAYSDLLNTIKSGDTTIRGTANDTADFAEKFTLLKNRIAAALIPLGTAFFNAVNASIPVVNKLADLIGAVSRAFDVLPAPVQSAAGGLLILGAGLAGIAAVGGKIIGIGIATAEAWTQAATAFGATAVASEAAAGGMATAGTVAEVADAKALPLLGTLGKLAAFAATGIVIVVTATIALDAVKSGKTGQPSYVEKIANDAISGIASAIRKVGGTQIADALDAQVAAAEKNMSARDITLGLGFKLDQKKGTVDKAIEAGVHGTVIGALVPDSWIPQVQHADDVIDGLGLTVDEVQKKADAAGVSFEDMLVKLADAAGITNPQIEAYKQAQQGAATATTAAGDATEATTQSIEDQTAALNQQYLAQARSQGLLLPFTRDAEDAQKATEDFNKTLDGITDASLNAARGVADISSELPGLQTGFGKVGESVVDVFRHMDDLGVIDLSPMARGALDAISTLDKVEAKIKGVEAAIQQNQGDMNMWAGRISLVESVFGASTQTISEWVDELQNGQITQEQFNGAIASLGGSGGFPKLDALLAQGKINQNEYNKAKEAGIWLLQRSAGGMQDEDAQLVQNIIDLANYAKAHDDADGAVKGLTDKQREFVAAMGDSKTQTFLQTLQLLVYLATVGQIPASKVTKFIADSSAADPVLQGVIADLGLLDDGTTVPIDGDSTGYTTTAQGVKDDKIPDKTVKVNVQVGDGTGDPNAPGFGAPTPDIPPIVLPAPDPIPITSEDKTADGINAAETSLSQFGTDAAANAGAAGTATGNAFSDGLAAGLQRSTAIAGASAAGILGALSSVANGVYNYGFNGGYNFGIGVANGIAATWNAVFNAAFNVGYAAYLGNQAGMQAHSPSKLGLKGGANWGTSVAMGIASTASDVLNAGKALGASLAGVISAPDLSPSLRAAALSADSRPRGDLLAGDRGGNVSHRSVTLNQTIHFDGITDTGEIIDRVNTQTYQALTRAQAAGAFGG